MPTAIVWRFEDAFATPAPPLPQRRVYAIENDRQAFSVFTASEDARAVIIRFFQSRNDSVLMPRDPTPIFTVFAERCTSWRLPPPPDAPFRRRPLVIDRHFDEEHTPSLLFRLR